MRSFLLVVHILAAGSWIGANLTKVVVTPRLTKVGGTVAADWMRSTVAMGRVLYTPAAIVALATGVGLVLESSLYEFEDPFVVVGIVVVVVGAALGMVVFGPKGEAAAKAFDSGDTSQAASVMSRLTVFGVLDTALLVIAVTVMVTRWGV